MELENTKSIIVDGNNLGWMAYGIVPLTHNNRRVEAIFIGLNMVLSYLRSFEPEKFCVVWDSSRDAERLKIYPNYKRRRKELSEGEQEERKLFFAQLKGFQDLMKTFGIPQYKVKGREADDVIFSIIDTGDWDGESIIVSTDKDFFQALSDENIRIYNPVKKMIVGLEDVEKRFDIPIEYVLEYRAMAGDPSDNLPGVKGIGDKWAAWLVNNIIREEAVDLNGFGSLSNSQIGKINLLHDNLDTFNLMKKLMAFKRLSKEELETGRFEDRPVDLGELQERVIVTLQEYGFEKYLNSLPSFIKPFEMLWRKGVKDDK